MLKRRMATHSIVLRFAVVLLFVATARSHAQTGNPDPPPAAAEPSRGATAPVSSVPVDPGPVDAHSISLDVRVTDKLGHPISGLKPGDFTLLDNKLPGKILDLHEVDASSSAAEPVQVVIVIDTLNAEIDTIAREREQLTEFLKQNGGHLAYPTSLAMLTDKGLKMGEISTLDGALLQASLDDPNSELHFIGKGAHYWETPARLQWSIDQLAALAAFEAKQPGRKVALILGPGWPMLPFISVDVTDKQRRWAFNYIVGLNNSLREAHLALYVVNPFTLGRIDPFYYESYLKGISNVNQATFPDISLQVLAAHSGGLVEITGLDILGELNTANRDAYPYYSLTFETSPGAAPNEYHDLHVAVDKPGAKVRTSAGYYSNVQYILPAKRN
jgi:VWFA-related protein